METKSYRYRIKTINRIARESLFLFDDKYRIDPDETNPQGIIVRSSPVDTDAFPELLAVVRAGAGVNNITVDKATGSGVCVFNTPGANANAVSELVFTMLGIWVRNMHRGMKFCADLAGKSDEDIRESVEKEKSAFKGIELAGKTLGIIGLGKIGVTVANSGLHRNMNADGL